MFGSVLEIIISQLSVISVRSGFGRVQTVAHPMSGFAVQSNFSLPGVHEREREICKHSASGEGERDLKG